MNIAGGYYLEHCEEPYWHELYGSGVRAAAAIGAVAKNLHLHTSVFEDDVRSLVAKASAFGFTTDYATVGYRTCFTYAHGLCTPAITPHPLQMKRGSPLKVGPSESVLRFGFIETDAVVQGERVVYDPQSAYDPRPFWDNGSTAKHLAIVANRSEARMLTRTDDEEEMLTALLTGQNVEVVVIKRGARGALLATKTDRAVIPAYETDLVSPIGSGDVFGAFFALNWADRGIPAHDAATKASKAAAYYCNGAVLPVAADYEKNFRFIPIVEKDPGREKTIYLAGPFFTMAQRWLIREALQHLSANKVRVFSPFHAVGAGPAHEIYTPDIEGLEKSDVVFACVDGLDSGTLYEIGYARARGKTVIVFVQNEGEGDMKMIVGGECVVCSDFCTAIYKAIWATLRA